jgi:hypothetical protein
VIKKVNVEPWVTRSTRAPQLYECTRPVCTNYSSIPCLSQLFFKILAKVVGFGHQAKLVQTFGNATESIADILEALDQVSAGLDTDGHNAWDEGTKQWIAPPPLTTNTDCVTDHVTDHVTDRLTDGVTDHVTDRVTDGVTDRVTCVTISARQGTERVREYCHVKRQWALVTSVTDRCFALVFCALNVLALVLFFPRPRVLRL